MVGAEPLACDGSAATAWMTFPPLLRRDGRFARPLLLMAATVTLVPFGERFAAWPLWGTRVLTC